MLTALLFALTLGQEPARPSFAEWLAGVRAEAIAKGVRTEIVDAALADVTEPQPVILERDRAQAETVFSLEKYLARILTRKLILNGREAFANHRELLDEVSERYGVPSRIIAAIWGWNRITDASAGCGRRCRRWPRSPGIRGAPPSSAASCSMRSRFSIAATSTCRG